MTSKKLLSRLLKMKGFRVTWFQFHEESRLLLGVKPHKTGCRCPHCGRRCKILHPITACRQWNDVIICGMRCIFFIRPKRSFVQPTGGSRNRFRGPATIHV